MGQTSLSIGAMVLLSTIILAMNRTFLFSGNEVLKSEIGITATSLAESIIEEASGKAFDRACINTSIHSTSTCTPASNLGPESSEIHPRFNDFDDFNGLVLNQSIPRAGVYTITCSVVYVNPDNPNQTSSTPTWHKKLTVYVSSPTMTDTVRMSYVFSYWYFR